MIWFFDHAAQAMLLAASMAWAVLWSLVLGFVLSGLIQSLVSPERLKNLLGDDGPRALALATRAVVETAAQSVLEHAGRALGARPFCMDARFAAMAADLPVFLRQSHAERDLEALGLQVLSFEPSWMQLHQAL